MRLCFFGAYDPLYPRHNVIKRGLVMNKVEVSECRLSPKYKFWLRYPLFLFRYPWLCKKNDFILVPEFCQKDVPLAKFLSLFSSARLVFDPLASRYETKITDWKRKPEDSWQARWNFKIDRWAFKLSDLVLADTQAHKEYYCQKYGLAADKVAVLPVGFDDSLFVPLQAKNRKGRFSVLFYGSFLPLHGVEAMIQAAKSVSAREPSIQFRFVGSGQTMPRAQALAAELECSNVYFEDWMPQEKLPEKIASADLCLGIFGITEKSKRVVPHKIFQALAMKTPVITARTPAVEEFFSHRENIFLCTEPFPASLTQAILELKEDEALRKRIAENGHDLVHQNFAPAALGLSLKRMLNQFLSKDLRK
jgi:glycosyltransferase involved in cell wall biosynthesis